MVILPTFNKIKLVAVLGFSEVLGAEFYTIGDFSISAPSTFSFFSKIDRPNFRMEPTKIFSSEGD